MKYEFNYKETKHTQDIIDYMEEKGINPREITEEERNDIIKNIFGIFTKNTIKYFDKI